VNDILARLMDQWLSEHLSQPFVIENKPGAGSNIATETVVRSPADGYTLLVVSAANAINATLYDKLNFNFLRDIVPVAGIGRVSNVMVVNPSFPAKTVPEFIAYATLPDAKQIGIDVLPFETQTASPKPEQPPPERQTPAQPSPRETSNQAISNRAQLFVREMYLQFARANSVDWLRPLYAQQVMFYGKQMSRDEVLGSLRLEIEKWPERNYRFQDASMNVTCREGRVGAVEPVPAPMECTVTGRMSWVGRSAARNAVARGGIDGFSYVLQISGNTFIIKEEQVYPVVEPTFTPIR
jgi:hypothetical protein